MILRSIYLPAVAAAVLLAGCAATPPVATGINDPNEDRNRRVHAFNKSVDRDVLRPVSRAYGEAVPRPVRASVSNFADNLSTPGYIVNDILQGNVHDAGSNFMRFVVNSTFGLAGLLDVATDMGIPERSADFGETMHVWGIAEGNYVEAPFFGPTTERDQVGSIVDLFTNPLSYVVPSPESYAMTTARGLAFVGTRYEFGDLVDSILYESADSYAQSRLLYLERRRFELQGSAPVSEEVYDPNADPFAEYE